MFVWILTLGLAANFSATALAFDLAVTMAEADQAYQSADCVKSVKLYRQAFYSPQIAVQDKELILFRTSYCYLQLTQTQAAASGFQKFLEKSPGHEEARLRLAQALYQLKDLSSAKTQVLNIRSEPYVIEAILLAAQIEIEQGEPLSAIKRLGQTKTPDDWLPIFYYWQGVAQYQYGDFSRAEAYFYNAKQLSPNTLWVKKDAQAWIDQIHRDQQWLHGNLVLGYLRDENLAQQSIVTADNLAAVELGPKSSTYIKDNAYYLAADLSFVLHYEPVWSLIATTSFTSPYYTHNDSYNNQNWTVGFSGTYKAAPKVNTGFSLKYQDSRYRNIYYQDYLIATSDVVWQMRSNLQLRLELPLTWYLKTRFYKTYAPSLSASYALPWGNVFAGISYSRTQGKTGTYAYYDTYAYVYEGALFTNYRTMGAYIGLSAPLPYRFSATGQAAMYKTKYDKDMIPISETNYVPKDRVDILHVLSAEISRAMIPSVWTLAAALTYSTNRSRGLQGFAYGGLISDYNYDRTYLLVTSTLSF